MILIDFSHTSHTRARTGIQRVARSLLHECAALAPVAPITWDPHAAEWRRLVGWELQNLDANQAGGKRSATWPFGARWAGRWRGWRRGTGSCVASELRQAADGQAKGPAGLFVPELFGASTARAYPALFKAVAGPRVALFHDAIALQMPEISPQKTVARYPSYLLELAGFDGVAAVSEDSRQTLVDFWAWAGLTHTPPVRTVANGIRPPPSGIQKAPPPPRHHPLRILCVGTLEGRKNHLALLEACESLWSTGAEFSLKLVGAVQAETGAAARDRALALAAAGRPLRLEGALTDEAVEAAYRDCDFTVYPSLIEGFGLPVLESVAHGKPCLCSAQGALGEAARGGGCVPIDRVDRAGLAGAISRLLAKPDELDRLGVEATSRPVRTSADQARELLAFLADLSSSPVPPH